jgi:hypothetical protein
MLPMGAAPVVASHLTLEETGLPRTFSPVGTSRPLQMHATLYSIARHKPNVATVQVKESVALLTGVAPEKQKIFFGGRELENADTLAHSLWEALKKVRGICPHPSATSTVEKGGGGDVVGSSALHNECRVAPISFPS